MKKFLTVLLVIAVMFTFSFSTAMAASYTAADYASAYTAEMNNQLSYLATAKAKWVNDFTYNNEGFIKDDFNGPSGADAIEGYSKAALEAGADALIKQLTTAMSLAIGKNTTFTDTTDVAPDLSVIKNAYDLDGNGSPDSGEVEVSAVLADFAGVAEAHDAVVAAIEKTQAPLTKAAVEAKLAAVDLSKYDTKVKKYNAGSETVTAAEYVQYLIGEANTAIAAATGTDADKRDAYEQAYSTFASAFDPVPTLEEQAVADGETVKTIEGAVNAYLNYGIETGYGDNKFAKDDDLTDEPLATTFASFIDASKKTVFGVSVANLAKITAAEANAINNAYYDAIKASADVVKVYANGVEGNDDDKVSAIEALYDDTDFATFLTTLSDAIKVADLYEDVVEYGNELKATTKYGVKQYDDAKVDEAVADIEELVYGDLGTDLSKVTVEDYFIEVTDKTNIVDALKTLEAVNYTIDEFEAAIKEAQKKFYSNAPATTTPAVKITYGENKTPEEDLVYLKGTYCAACSGDDWDEIAKEAVAALAKAESYADIDAALAKAAEDLSKLELATDHDKVATAKVSYKTALAEYVDEQKAIMGLNDYDEDAFLEAKTAGEDLIDEATTVDGVKAAYAEAQALIRGILTKDALADAKEAVIDAIAKLPLVSALTAADKNTVLGVYEAYKSYVETPGADDLDIINKAILVADINKVLGLEAEELNKKLDDAQEALDKLTIASDADCEKIAAMRADLQALVDAGNALNDLIDEMYEVDGLETVSVTTVNTEIINYFETALAPNGKVWIAEVEVVEALAVIATKVNATQAEKMAAIDAYNKLTDRQKYSVDANVIELIENLVTENVKLILADTNIIARSTRVAKGIRVTVYADVSALTDAGFTVEYKFYRSTKKASGYVYKLTSKTGSYTNTAGTKGVKYYYKAKLVVKNAAGEVVAESPIKQCSYACRTWTK